MIAKVNTSECPINILLPLQAHTHTMDVTNEYFDAIQEKDEKALRAAITAHPGEINQEMNEDVGVPLLHAISTQWPHGAQIILEAGGDPRIEDADGLPAIFSLLTYWNNDPNDKIEMQQAYTDLFLAMLSDERVDPNEQRQHETPLMGLMVINMPNIQPTILLAAAQPRVNLNVHSGLDGNTALHQALRADLDEIAVEFVNLGADPTIQNNLGENALHTAAEMLDMWFITQVVELATLETRTTLIQTRTRDGQTALHRALFQQEQIFQNRRFSPESQLRTVQWLLDHGDDFEAVDNNGNTALHWAALADVFSIKVIQLLRIRGAGSVNQKNGLVDTPLHMLFANTQQIQNWIRGKSFADVLAEAWLSPTPDRPNMSVRDISPPRNTYLHLFIFTAAQTDSMNFNDGDREKMVDLIVTAGGDPNARNDHEETPLFMFSRQEALFDSFAVFANHLIKKYNVDKDARNNKGHTPWHALVVSEVKGIFDEPQLADVMGEFNTLSQAKNFFVLEHGAQLNPQDVFYDTPMHLAADKRSFELVNMLFEEGIATVLNDRGEMPIDRVPVDMRRLEGFVLLYPPSKLTADSVTVPGPSAAEVFSDDPVLRKDFTIHFKHGQGSFIHTDRRAAERIGWIQGFLSDEGSTQTNTITVSEFVKDELFPVIQFAESDRLPLTLGPEHLDAGVYNAANVIVLARKLNFRRMERYAIRYMADQLDANAARGGVTAHDFALSLYGYIKEITTVLVLDFHQLQALMENYLHYNMIDLVRSPALYRWLDQQRGKPAVQALLVRYPFLSEERHASRGRLVRRFDENISSLECALPGCTVSECRLTCANCRIVPYCGAQHQQEHWTTEHHTECP